VTRALPVPRRPLGSIPARAGIGLKPEHYHEIFETRPDVGWFEIHAENYMAAGGPALHYLEKVRERYPLSVHGVGLSIGGAGALDRRHLARLRALIDRFEPGLFSEHLAWSSHGGAYFGDLLPLPYTQETLDCVAAHVDEVQCALGRPMLLENPSAYVAFESAEMSETEFLAGLCRRTGCGLLLDVSNVYVSSVNQGFDAAAYIDAFPIEGAGEIHLAGCFDAGGPDGGPLLLDAHDSPVRDEVWALHRRAVRRAGAVPTLIEWDNHVPPLRRLVDEARRADDVILEWRKRHESPKTESFEDERPEDCAA
jgi:uncharacterized protein (UPF0276 family)